MMPVKCGKADCTVAETGVCLLNNKPEACPEKLAAEAETKNPTVADTLEPPLSAPVRNPKFPSSLTLTPEGIRAACSSHPFRLVGILGAPDAGKTAVLVSLYLLLSRNKLEGFKFADSMSLRALDEFSRGAREWNHGQPPEQMTSHTEAPDPDHRTPGFLHLRLRERKSGTPEDVLLTDLPGEWSTSLIDSNRVDRLEFLKAADAIWVMIDGRQLIDPNARQVVLHRTGVLFERVSKFLGETTPAILVVISHKDAGEPPASSLRQLQADSARFKLALKVIQVASFSEDGSIEPGTGIAELIESALQSASATEPSILWPDSDIDGHDRQFLRFRG